MQLSTKLIIIWIIIFIGLIGATFSGSTASSTGDVFDILFHISVYAILAFVPILLFRKRIVAFMVTIAIAPIGFLLQWAHVTITTGNFENLILDALYNNMGIIIGISVAAIIRIKMHYGNEPSI